MSGPSIDVILPSECRVPRCAAPNGADRKLQREKRVILGNMRQRAGIILTIVLSGTFAAPVIWLKWRAVAAVCIYIGSFLAAAVLLLLSIRQTQVTGTDREAGEAASRHVTAIWSDIGTSTEVFC
jgi:hypothetical protein